MTVRYELKDKEEIIRLNRVLKLDDVMTVMERRGFFASTSWYRNKLREWGEVKRESVQGGTPKPAVFQPAPTKPLPRRPLRAQPFSPVSSKSHDSGYWTDPSRSSWSTAGSSPFSGPSRGPDPEPYSLNTTRVNTPQPPPIAHIVDASAHNTVRQFSRTQYAGYNWSRQTAPLSHREAALPSNWSCSTLIEAEQEQNFQKALYPRNTLEAPTTAHTYASSHPPNSRCIGANIQSFVPTLELGMCLGCEASKSHYVASVAKFLPHDALIEQVEDVQIHLNDQDIFLNTPLHFLASAGPTTRKQIGVFVDAKADIFRTNTDNENFLHVLDPSGLGNELPLLLAEIWIRAPSLLRARTFYGKTVLHCLLKYSISVDLLIEILPIFQSAGNNINARDNQGLTAMEIFCNSWLSAQDPHQRSHEEWNAIQAVLDMYVPDLKLLGHEKRQITAVTLPPGLSTSDVNKILAGLSPNGRYSGNHSSAAQELRYVEMRAIMAESKRNALAHDYRGRNGIHCLAHTIQVSPDLGVSWEIHRRDLNYLMDMLGRGVDPIDFDRLGQTPLHAILSASYNSQDENFRAVLINSLIRHGTGHEVHMRDGHGEIPLHLACKSGFVTCVEMLLCHKSNLDALNLGGWSVIHEAKQRTLKMHNDPEEVMRIQQCISLVEKAGGYEFPIPLENLVYNNHARKLYNIHDTPEHNNPESVPLSVDVAHSLLTPHNRMAVEHSQFSRPLPPHATYSRHP